MNQSMMSMNTSMSQSQKKGDFATELKKDMQKVRDVAKKSEKYAVTLEKDNFTVQNLDEHKEFQKKLDDTLKLAESCIEKLMSEQGNAKISNIEVLLDKMLTFQGQITNVKEIFQTIEVTERPGAGLQRFATQVQNKQPGNLEPDPDEHEPQG